MFCMQVVDFFLDLNEVYEVQVDREVHRRQGQQPLQDLKASLAKQAAQVGSVFGAME
jgi:hypothetical protein